MKINISQRLVTAVVICLMVTLTASAAYAGPLTGILAYVQTNLVGDIITLAIIALGLILFAMHVNWWLVIGICGGCWIIANPQILAQAFTGGG